MAPLLTELPESDLLKSTHTSLPETTAAPGSRRNIDGSDGGRLDLLGERLVVEVELECLTQVGKSLVEALPLAGQFHLESAGQAPGGLVKRLRWSAYRHSPDW